MRKAAKKKLHEQKRKDAERLIDPTWVNRYVRHLERWQTKAREEGRVRVKLQNYVKKHHEPSFPAATPAKGERALHDVQLHDV